MTRILITGAGGVVGRGVRPFLAREFSELVLVGRNWIETIADNETSIQGDISEPEVIAKAMTGVDGVLHLACAYGLDISFEDTLETNYVGLVSLLDGFIAAGGKNFVFASSHHGWGFYPRSDGPILVAAPPKPDGWYGVSKVFGEAALAFYAHAYGFSATSLRIGNTDEKVIDERRTHMWCSFRDLAGIAARALKRRVPGHVEVYPTANCEAPFFDNSDLAKLGYAPLDKPEDHLASPDIVDEPAFPGIAGESVGGAYTETNLKTDISSWRRSVGR